MASSDKSILESKIEQKFQNQAQMLANRVKKKFNHFHKRFARQNIDVFRLYDWDIPEIRAVVDWYAGHLVIGEYTRTQSTPQWLPMMGEAVAKILEVPPQNVHLKERRAGKKAGNRYERINFTDKKIIVSERDFKFYVNPYDFVDTGLFSDHRDTRQMIREIAKGKDFLNLYCYTGTFTCYAAKGGAKSTVSVDRSESAICWARENMALNGFNEPKHQLFHAHSFDYLKKAKQDNRFFDLAVVDPPSYSTTRTRNEDFDITRDHPRLLREVIALMIKGGTIFFSTNHQGFEPRFDDLGLSEVLEITSRTIPEDYVSKRKTIHRCWKIIV
jgi:23S rRNA (cytosine1962-C5)-methyltransferase